MARTFIREQQVLDSDFASEVEMSDVFNQHIIDHIHIPTATVADKYLYYDGNSYTWSTIANVDLNSLLPIATQPNMIIKSNDLNQWITVKADDPINGLKVIAVSNEAREINAYRIKKFKLNEIFDFFYENMNALEMFFFEYGDYIRDLEMNT